MRLDPAAIKHQIESLLVSYPELADDEVLRDRHDRRLNRPG